MWTWVIVLTARTKGSSEGIGGLKMPRSSSVSTINRTKSGQAVVTIPRPIADAMSMDHGTKVTWKLKGAGKLEMEVKV